MIQTEYSPALRQGQKSSHSTLSLLSLATYLSLLTIALVCAVQHGGLEVICWNTCLLIVGLTACWYWLSTPPGTLGYRIPTCLRWTLLLLPVYVTIQLVPLPFYLVQILSPARAELAQRLGSLAPTGALIPLSIGPGVTSEHLLRIVGYTLAFFLIRDIASRCLQRRPWAAAVPLITIALAEAVLGFMQNWANGEVHGTYGNKNHFSGLLEMALPLTLMCGIATLPFGHAGRSPRSSVIKGSIILSIAGLICAGLLVSGSKTGFLVTVGSLFLMGVFAMATSQLKVWTKLLTLFGLVILLAFVLLFSPPDELVRAYGGLVSDGLATGEGRWPIWRNTLSLIGAYPLFGCGLGNFGTAFLKYQTAVVDSGFEFAHNDFLQTAAELGAVGFAILAVLMVAVFVTTLRAAARRHHRNTRCLGLACAASMMAIGLHSVTDFNMYMPANALVLAWISGIATSLSLRSGPDKPEPVTGHPRLVRSLAVVISGLLIVYGSAWILFETLFVSELYAEELFCRAGICDTDAMLTAQTLGHGGNVAAVPPAQLIEALRRDAASPHRWCDLGEAMLQRGHWDQAGFCFSNALALGPDVPPIRIRAFRFYYRIGESEKALEQTAHVLEKTAAYDDFVFAWYKERDVPLAQVLSKGLPPGNRAIQAYLRHLLKLGATAEVMQVWNWALAHGAVDDGLESEYLNFLFKEKRYEAAAHSWARYLGDRGKDYLQKNWLYNGDFESEPSVSPFDWAIDKVENVEVAWDSNMKRTGTRCLRIRFDGQKNLNYGHIAQTAFVTPGKYRFEAYIRTEAITTDQGIAFGIFDREGASPLRLKTEQTLGTRDWTKIEQVFSVPPQTRLLKIEVIRQPSWRFDNQISGTAWIDTVRLVRLDQ